MIEEKIEEFFKPNNRNSCTCNELFSLLQYLSTVKQRKNMITKCLGQAPRKGVDSIRDAEANPFLFQQTVANIIQVDVNYTMVTLICDQCGVTVVTELI